MELPSVLVAARRPVLVPELVIPFGRPLVVRPAAPERSRPERRPAAPRRLGARRGVLVDVYA